MRPEPGNHPLLQATAGHHPAAPGWGGRAGACLSGCWASPRAGRSVSACAVPVVMGLLAFCNGPGVGRLRTHASCGDWALPVFSGARTCCCRCGNRAAAAWAAPAQGQDGYPERRPPTVPRGAHVGLPPQVPGQARWPELPQTPGLCPSHPQQLPPRGRGQQCCHSRSRPSRRPQGSEAGGWGGVRAAGGQGTWLWSQLSFVP